MLTESFPSLCEKQDIVKKTPTTFDDERLVEHRKKLERNANMLAGEASRLQSEFKETVTQTESVLKIIWKRHTDSLLGGQAYPKLCICGEWVHVNRAGKTVLKDGTTLHYVCKEKKGIEVDEFRKKHQLV